jgi:hypothetical protein
VGPLDKRGHSWRQVPENGVGRSRERAPEAWVQVWAPFKKLGASGRVENKGAANE